VDLVDRPKLPGFQDLARLDQMRHDALVASLRRNHLGPFRNRMRQRLFNGDVLAAAQTSIVICTCQ
jgi:hypothetical protein